MSQPHPVSRADFLKTSLMGGLGLGLLGTTTGTRPGRPPLPLGQVKVSAIETYVLDSAVFVKVSSDAGVVGWGEANHDSKRLTAKTIEDVLAPRVLGQDPFQGERFWHEAFFVAEDIGGGLLLGAMAGLDNALWDLRARLLGLPIHQLVGSMGLEKIRVYGSFARGEDTPKPDDALARTAAEFVALGYRTVKIRMQIRQLGVDPDPDPTFQTVKAIRSAIGDGIELYVDFNNGYTPAKATALGLRLYEQLGVAAIEEPVSQLNYAGLRQVADALPIPVFAGEHEFHKWQMRDLIVEGGADVINADVIKCGGLTEVRKVAALAHAFDRPILLHNARPTLCTAMALQLVNSIPNHARVLEYAGPRPNLKQLELFQNYFRFEDGYLYIPQTPGVGLEPNEELLAQRRLNK